MCSIEEEPKWTVTLFAVKVINRGLQFVSVKQIFSHTVA